MTRPQGVAVMAEVVAVLARHATMRVAPLVADERDGVTITLHVAVDGVDGNNGLEVLELHHQLLHLQNVATMRHLCSELNIKADQLQALLPAMHDDVPPPALRHLTVQEIEALVAVLLQQPGSEDIDAINDRRLKFGIKPFEEAAPQQLVESALPKLVALARALGGAV